MDEMSRTSEQVHLVLYHNPRLCSTATAVYVVAARPQILPLSKDSISSSTSSFFLTLQGKKSRVPTMAASLKIGVAIAAFSALGLAMLAVVIYTVVTDGLPFRRELLTPWMTATLLDFYINVAAISVWVAYKESAIIKAAFWVVLLICLGSITTCAYVVKQLCHLLFQDARQDSFYHILLPHSSSEKKTPVVVGRVIFSLLGCLMLAVLIYTLITDGSPFRKELFTPWMTATLIDFYINVIAISAWVAHKERTWIAAAFWIVLLICFGSITTCAYIVIQLFHFSSGDPLHLIFLEPRGKQEAHLQSK